MTTPTGTPAEAAEAEPRGGAARPGRPRGGIQARVTAALLLLGAAVVAAGVRELVTAEEEVLRAERVVAQTALADDLFQAVRHLGFERGRVNVVLGHAGPLDEMAGNRAFVAERRAAGEAALSNALARLGAGARGREGAAVARIAAARAALAEVRAAADEDMLRPRLERRAGLQDRWFRAASALIDAIADLLAQTSLHGGDADGPTARLAVLKLKSLALRDAAGPEISILSATMLSGRPLPPERLDAITRHRAEIALHRQEIARLAAGIDAPEVTAVLPALWREFDEHLAPLRERVLAEALRGGPYSVPQPEFLAAGVQALEAVSRLMDGTLLATRRHVEAQRSAAIRARGWALALLAAALALVAATLHGIHRHVTTPVSRLSSTLRALAAGELPASLPVDGTVGEVAALEASANQLRDAAIQQRADAAARRSAEARLRSAERLAATGVLARGLAHEINSPLACVVSNVAFAREQLPAEPAQAGLGEAQRALDDAADAAARIRELVRELRRFAEPPPGGDAARLPVGEALVEARRIAGRELAACREVRVEAGADLRPDVPAPDLVQLLALLLANAGQATGATPNDVTIRARVAGAALEIEVADTGVGMDDAVLARAFDPFFTTRDVGRGRGLGLSVCHGIVHAVGGDIALRSAPGAGTTVTVRLPATTAPGLGAAARVPAAGRGRAAAPAGAGEVP